MDQSEFLTVALELLERLGIPYMVVGSLASAAYGEPRATLDADIVIDPTVAQVKLLCAGFSPSDIM